MPSYLVRRLSGWHFRMRVPEDLQPILARRKLKETSQDALASNELADATWEVDKLLSDQEIKLEANSLAY